MIAVLHRNRRKAKLVAERLQLKDPTFFGDPSIASEQGRLQDEDAEFAAELRAALASEGLPGQRSNGDSQQRDDEDDEHDGISEQERAMLHERAERLARKHQEWAVQQQRIQQETKAGLAEEEAERVQAMDSRARDYWQWVQQQRQRGNSSGANRDQPVHLPSSSREQLGAVHEHAAHGGGRQFGKPPEAAPLASRALIGDSGPSREREAQLSALQGNGMVGPSSNSIFKGPHGLGIRPLVDGVGSGLSGIEGQMQQGKARSGRLRQRLAPKAERLYPNDVDSDDEATQFAGRRLLDIPVML